ncbi:TadE/TadG family type IV pilus assembly protein [Actinoplanes sp. G11-F43]|uniref:TadE/TadG family type IV pilus assembly protein n=1 Tax=Actinoplanes sp. G11-F43 TaxID=3424130 RepID=UPI003D33313E
MFTTFIRRRRKRDSEHGGVAVIVALFLGSAVLFGSGALVIDVGLLYHEREQLISGADAASFKVAINCANDPTACTPAAQTTVAGTYARNNALDGQTAAQLCFNDTGCPTWNTTKQCLPRPPIPVGTYPGNWVEVRTSTITRTGGTIIPPALAGVATGGTYQGTRVGACARVAWGPPAVDKVFALGISLCDWERMTNNGQVFYNPLGTLLNDIGLFQLIGLPSPAPGQDSAIPQVLPLTALGLPLPSCTTPVDLTRPRGYVWLSNPDLTPPDADCMIDLKVDDLPRSFVLSGLLVGVYCAQKLQALRTAGAPILVPIFDKIVPELVSLAPQYHIVGFAPFVVTGYTGLLSGVLTGVTSLLSGSLLGALQTVLCGTGSCIYGYFTKVLLPRHSPVFGNGRNFGATVVGRIG